MHSTTGSGLFVLTSYSAEQVAEHTAVGRTRAKLVVAAMRHAWAGYKAHAWGADALLPRSGGREDNWGGMGMTLLDSLDTLWIMGMKVRLECDAS